MHNSTEKNLDFSVVHMGTTENSFLIYKSRKKLTFLPLTDAHKLRCTWGISEKISTYNLMYDMWVKTLKQNYIIRQKGKGCIIIPR